MCTFSASTTQNQSVWGAGVFCVVLLIICNGTSGTGTQQLCIHLCSGCVSISLVYLPEGGIAGVCGLCKYSAPTFQLPVLPQSFAPA